MPRVIVEVMPRPEVTDPRGRTISAVLPRVGFEGFGAVRQGKRFEIDVEGEITDEVLTRARALAEELLANPLTEQVTAVRAARPAVVVGGA